MNLTNFCRKVVTDRPLQVRVIYELDIEKHRVKQLALGVQRDIIIRGQFDPLIHRRNNKARSVCMQRTGIRLQRKKERKEGAVMGGWRRS